MFNAQYRINTKTKWLRCQAVYFALYRTKSKCRRRFWDIDPENSRTCFMSPCRAFHVCFFFFPAGNVGSPKTQISKKCTKSQIFGGKKTRTHTHIRKRLCRGTLNTCGKFQGLLSKNGLDIGLWRIWGLYSWTSFYAVRGTDRQQHIRSTSMIRVRI